eukprot:10028558-Lingulodinium_polyedra.AAC.1
MFPASAPRAPRSLLGCDRQISARLTMSFIKSPDRKRTRTHILSHIPGRLTKMTSCNPGFARTTRKTKFADLM